MAQTLTLSEQKNLDILEAASNLFMEFGFSDVSMDAIAERAAVSKRTVYNHFESKDALVEAIIERMVKRFKEAMRFDYDPAMPLDVQLRKIAELQVATETNEEFLATARMLIAGMLTSPIACQDALKEAKAKEDPMLIWTQAAIQDGRLQVDDVTIAARLFRSMIESIFFWPGITGAVEVPEGAEREAILDSAVRMFLARYSTEG